MNRKRKFINLKEIKSFFLLYNGFFKKYQEKKIKLLFYPTDSSNLTNFID
jgi:hypothetical protein